MSPQAYLASAWLTDCLLCFFMFLRRRGVQLHILSPGMEKRRTNTTRYDGRMQLLHWHIEWSFPAVGIKVADSK